MTAALLAELRDRFRESTAGRLQEMCELLDTLARDRADAATLEKLARHFHALAGLGATYGYPRVSELGDEGEAAILPMTRSGTVPPTELVARWRELVDGVASLVAVERVPAAIPVSGSCDVLIPGREQAAPRILAVEDDPTQILLFQRVLGDAGYEVAVCSDPAAFEECLHAFGPDLLLMDVHLTGQGRSGHDLVRSARESERFAALPVIFVTSDSVGRMMEEGAGGGDLLVTKPVNWRLLLAQVASRLGATQPKP